MEVTKDLYLISVSFTSQAVKYVNDQQLLTQKIYVSYEAV